MRLKLAALEQAIHGSPAHSQHLRDLIRAIEFFLHLRRPLSPGSIGENICNLSSPNIIIFILSSPAARHRDQIFFLNPLLHLLWRPALPRVQTEHVRLDLHLRYHDAFRKGQHQRNRLLIRVIP